MSSFVVHSTLTHGKAFLRATQELPSTLPMHIRFYAVGEVCTPSERHRTPIPSRTRTARLWSCGDLSARAYLLFCGRCTDSVFCTPNISAPRVPMASCLTTESFVVSFWELRRPLWSCGRKSPDLSLRLQRTKSPQPRAAIICAKSLRCHRKVSEPTDTYTHYLLV